MTPTRILTVCSAGICRSVGMADVLKCHFRGAEGPVDAVPLGVDRNSQELFGMLGKWADMAIVMHHPFTDRVLKYTGLPEDKVFLCEVGPDVYGGSSQGRAILIDKCWRWLRANKDKLGLTEDGGMSWLKM